MLYEKFPLIFDKESSPKIFRLLRNTLYIDVYELLLKNWRILFRIYDA